MVRLSGGDEDRLLGLLRDKGVSCPWPNCRSRQFRIFDFIPHAHGSADVKLICTVDPHPYPGAGGPWAVFLTREELRRAGIDTGL